MLSSSHATAATIIHSGQVGENMLWEGIIACSIATIPLPFDYGMENEETEAFEPQSSIRSTRSAASVRVFKHYHLTYRTCFGCLHVRTATVIVGASALLMICVGMFYSVFASMEENRPIMKLFTVPSAVVAISLLYLLVGVIQERPALLYPFITVQIVSLFATAICATMLALAVGCHTRYILRVFVTVDDVPRSHYMKHALALSSTLLAMIFVQLWALRSVCSCFRYFMDLARFKAKQADLFA